MGPASNYVYVPSILRYNAAVCCLVRSLFAGVGVLILYGSSRISDRLTAVLLVGGAVYHSTGLTAYYVASQMIPLLVLLAALALGWAYIHWTHKQCTMSLKKGEGRSPSNAEVTEALARFDSISHWIAIITPFLGLIMLCTVAVLSR
jgi:hypothetical protein